MNKNGSIGLDWATALIILFLVVAFCFIVVYENKGGKNFGQETKIGQATTKIFTELREQRQLIYFLFFDNSPFKNNGNFLRIIYFAKQNEFENYREKTGPFCKFISDSLNDFNMIALCLKSFSEQDTHGLDELTNCNIQTKYVTAPNCLSENPPIYFISEEDSQGYKKIWLSLEKK